MLCILMYFFLSGQGLHSPNLNLMKMLEVVTRENQRSRLIGRRTGYIISTSSDPDPDISEELPASSLDSEKVLVSDLCFVLLSHNVTSV